MKNKKIIFLSLLVIILAIAGFAFFRGGGNVKLFSKCAKEGEAIGASGMPSLCCAGLKAVGGWPGGYKGDCTAFAPPTGLSLCSNCGNGACDIDNGENKCNCKEDCK
jgi:hypothetical protein